MDQSQMLQILAKGQEVLTKVQGVLKRVEWGVEQCGVYYCPYCEHDKETGHKEDCLLKECIDEL